MAWEWHKKSKWSHKLRYFRENQVEPSFSKLICRCLLNGHCNCKFQNVFVLIAKCICLNCKMYFWENLVKQSHLICRCCWPLITIQTLWGSKRACRQARTNTSRSTQANTSTSKCTHKQYLSRYKRRCKPSNMKHEKSRVPSSRWRLHKLLNLVRLICSVHTVYEYLMV